MPTGLIIAAAMHDVGHPGSNNHFLVATSAPLAIQVTRTAEPFLLSLSPASLSLTSLAIQVTRPAEPF